MRRALWMASMLLAAAAASADIVTLPAAASIQGGNPFFSDVRVFNTSYTSSLDVTATYRCFIATVACPSSPPQIQFTLAPRASQAFDDMVAAASGFATPDTAGGVEFVFSGTEDQLVVTSRLFSTFPQNSVGMFIPGLEEVDAHPTTVLTSIRHDPGTAAPANLAIPRATELLHGPADEDLDRVRTFGRIGQIPHTEVAPQLHRIEAGNKTRHGDSSLKRTGWGEFLPARGPPERRGRPNAAQRLPAARPGPGGRKIAVPACQSQISG